MQRYMQVNKSIDALLKQNISKDATNSQ